MNDKRPPELLYPNLAEHRKQQQSVFDAAVKAVVADSADIVKQLRHVALYDAALLIESLEAQIAAQSGASTPSETAKYQKAVSEDAAILTDAEIAKLWDDQRRFHGGEVCRVGHIEFARSLIAAIREEVPTAEPRIEEGRFGLVPLPRNLNGNTQHLVLSFAMALAAKLHAAEKKYGYSDGWQDPDWMDECRAKLLEHVAKGDPRDVAAYCAFLWFHNESTAPIAVTAVPAGYKIVPIVATNAMMNASVNAWHAWHSWKSRNNGGSIQELGSLVYEHMIDAAPEVPKTQLGNLDKPQNSQQTRGEGE